MLCRLPFRASLLIGCAFVVSAQEPPASELLAQALHFADLYNWADAAPAFTRAEQLFVAAGDKRNALYARLGRVRSNIERDQQTLPMVAAQLVEMAEDDPLVQNDKKLRLLCFIVKGDIDTEINTGAMRDDWEQVESLSRELGDAKWGYRALAQIGVAAFYDADLENARKDIGAALAAAKSAGDRGAEIRFLTILANGLVESKMYDQALAYLENATTIADGTPDAGYQFTAQELRVDALIGLKQLDVAQRVADDILTHARNAQRTFPPRSPMPAKIPMEPSQHWYKLPGWPRAPASHGCWLRCMDKQRKYTGEMVTSKKQSSSLNCRRKRHKPVETCGQFREACRPLRNFRSHGQVSGSRPDIRPRRGFRRFHDR